MKRQSKIPLCDVDLLEPKPNPLFQEWQRLITRFMRYTQPVPCAHCGRKSRHHWTQLRFFKVMDLGHFSMVPGKQTHPPLTPVCRKHIMSPIMPKKFYVDERLAARPTKK